MLRRCAGVIAIAMLATLVPSAVQPAAAVPSPPSPSNVVVLNDAGGVTSSDGLRIKIGAGWRNIVRNNKQQVYVKGADWPAGGSAAWNALTNDDPYNGVMLVVGNTVTCFYVNSWAGCSLTTRAGGGIDPTFTSYWWDSAVTTLDSAVAAPAYRAVTVLEKTISGVLYRLTMTTDYTSPNYTADVTYALTIPTGTNTENIRLYDAIDMYLDGNDNGPVSSFLFGGTGGLPTYVQYNDTAVGGFRERAAYPFGSWTGANYSCLFGSSGNQADCPNGGSGTGGNYGPYNGTNYPNLLSTNPAVDAAVGVGWNLGVVQSFTKGATIYFAAKTAGSGSIGVSPALGPIAGGTNLAITGTGTNFVSGATVTVGGKPCTPVVFVSPTSLTCTTTARAAATVDVIVTNPDTSYVSGAGLFTYGNSQTVTFNANGGTGSMSAQSSIGAAALTTNSFTRTGYTFAGWNTVAGGTGTAYANGASYPFSASETLYAQWSPVHTATFDANGGTGSMSPQTASSATALTSNTFTRTGFTFAGWNTVAGGTGTAYANGATYPFSASATLYAQWTVSGGGSSGGGSSGGGGSSDSSETPTPSPSSSASAAAAVAAQVALDPIPNRVNANIPAGGVPQGGSVYLVNGVPAPVTVTPDAAKDPTGLDVKGPDFFMRLAGYGDDADPLGLTEKNALVLQSQQESQRSARSAGLAPRSARFAPCVLRQPTAVSSGNGFKANSPVKFYLLPSTYIGELTTDGTGAYKGTLPIPVGVKAGSQTLQVNGFNAAGGVRSLSLGIQVELARSVVTATQKTQVFFDPMSPEISAEGKASLNKVVKKAKKQGIRTVVLGFVQQAGTSANDQSLSTQRARNVAAYLRSRGLTGAYVIRGDGVAGSGDAARRVNVTVRYNAGC
jgi:uncharacterized repeat protein (TIGR02543 family)